MNAVDAGRGGAENDANDAVRKERRGGRVPAPATHPASVAGLFPARKLKLKLKPQRHHQDEWLRCWRPDKSRIHPPISVLLTVQSSLFTFATALSLSQAHCYFFWRQHCSVFLVVVSRRLRACVLTSNLQLTNDFIPFAMPWLR